MCNQLRGYCAAMNASYALFAQRRALFLRKAAARRHGAQQQPSLDLAIFDLCFESSFALARLVSTTFSALNEGKDKL